MKTISVLVLALLLMLASGSQIFAEDVGAGTMGRTNGTVNDDDVGTRGLGAPGVRDRDIDTFDRNNVGTRGTGVGPGVLDDDNNDVGVGTRGYRTAAAGDANNGWGWLGILGLLGLAGMFGRNKNPER